MMKAQMNDSFTDGDFSSNPAWSGDIQQFKVNTAFQLQLNSGGEGQSSLVTPVSPADSMEWSFWVKLGFSPSENNLAKIFLLSDQQDLEGQLNGYYLKLGASGTDDAIELFRQTGNTSVSLCKGKPGLIASAFTLRIRVTRSSAGLWQVFTDPAGGTAWQPEASARDDDPLAGSWFGLSCKYTSSNSTKFFFDDFYAGTVIVDIAAPTILTLEVPASNSLKIEFSENAEAGSVSNTGNYLVDQGVGNPSVILHDGTNPARVSLAFPVEFQPDLTYLLSVRGVQDQAGNVMRDTNLTFSWHTVRSFDVLINELMCDPDPPVGLPAAEYMELYNRTGFSVDLTGWSITTGTSRKILPSCSLPAGGYLLVADDAFSEDLEPYGPVVFLSSFSLVNAGQELVLRNSEGSVIHAVTYHDSWYRNEYKQEGGWSLEQIDPMNPCGDADNWNASNDASGGTPGRVNSVSAANPDTRAPSISRIGTPDSSRLLITFSEPVDSASLLEPANYDITPDIGHPLSVATTGSSFRQAMLDLGSTIQEGVLYSVGVTGSFCDCAGNALAASTVIPFALPVKAGAQDIVINEILFDPREGCDDFVEIYNRSFKVVDLTELTLACLDTLTGLLTDVVNLSEESLLVFPGRYLVFTKDTAAIRLFYPGSDPDRLIRVEALPPLGNEDGSIALATRTGEIIDNLSYTSDMQYPLLTDAEGVSLERVNPERPSDDRSNWHSAAETAGYATPGYRNSQFGSVPEGGDGIILSSKIFSPDNDGVDDNLMISYSFPAPAFTARVMIFDATGHLVRNLVNNDLCGVSGCWSWDGISDKRTRVPAGWYVIRVEAFDMNGTVKRYKQAVAVGSRL